MKYKVGDKVKIIKRNDYRLYPGYDWLPEMNNTLNKIGIITKIVEHGYQVKFKNIPYEYWYYETSFVKCRKEKIKRLLNEI